MIKFYASNFYSPSIKQVEVSKETGSFVYIEEVNSRGKKTERRQAKQGKFDGFFDTFDDAKQYLRDSLVSKKNRYQYWLDDVNKKISEVDALAP